MGLGLTGNRNLRFVFEFLMLACRLLEQCTDDGDRQLEIQGGAAVFDRVCAVTAVLSTHFAISPPMHLRRVNRWRVVGSRSSADALALGRQT